MPTTYVCRLSILKNVKTINGEYYVNFLERFHVDNDKRWNKCIECIEKVITLKNKIYCTLENVSCFVRSSYYLIVLLHLETEVENIALLFISLLTSRPCFLTPAARFFNSKHAGSRELTSAESNYFH